jgi:hypothetical protein
MEKSEKRLSSALLRRITRLALAAFALAFLSSPRASSQDSGLGAAELSGADIALFPPASGSAYFRFLPDGPTLPFDRSLELSAAPGELRQYRLQAGSLAAIAEGSAPVTSYVIDKRRPPAPTAAPGTGLYSSSVEPALLAAEGCSLYWALVGPGGEAPSFAPYAADSRPRLSAPASGSASYTLIAYAVSASGVRGRPSRFAYRLTERGLPAAAPQPDSFALTSDPSLVSPRLSSGPGYAELSLVLPRGSSLLVAPDRGEIPSSLDDFEIVEPDENGVARFRITCPYSWSGELGLYFGVAKDSSASYSPNKLSLSLSYPPENKPLPPAPVAPALVSDSAGRASFLAFSAYDGDIFVSVGSGPSTLYSGPIAVAGQGPVSVSWYGVDVSGKNSPARSASFALPIRVPEVELSGVAEGACLGGDAVLKPALAGAAKTAIRYELRLDGSIPPEPSLSSPLVGEALIIACPPGEERQVALRYRGFSGDKGGEGKILRFTLDRKPPEPPSIVGTPVPFSDKGASIGLAPGLGGKDVFASVSIDGVAGPFSLVSAPLQFPGSESGPVAYLVKAYSVDAAGNKSKEMRAYSCVVDRSSVYVAEDGSDRGDGSPDRPYKSLDAALAAAIRLGKKNVNMRGSLAMRLPVRIASEINLAGGFDSSWKRDASARALVRVQVIQGKAVFSVEGGLVSLSKVELDYEGGSGPLLALSSAKLSLSDSSIVARSEGDLVLASCARSSVSLANSRVEATKAMAFTAFSAESSDISLEGSTVIAAEGVRIFGAFDLDGGSLSIRQSLLQSGSDLGLSLLSLRSSSLLVDRSVIRAQGGSGFLRLGLFKSVAGEIKDSEVLLSWKGPASLFESQVYGPALRHDTVIADSSAPLRFFDVRGEQPQLWNSIFDCSAPESEFLRSDAPPGAGAIVADCLWGFDSLLSGAREARDLASLNALNSLSALYSSKPCIAEPPERSFDYSAKGQVSLKRGSACIDAAMPLASGYGLDLGGRLRPAPGSSGPDIGAEEFSE